MKKIQNLKKWFLETNLVDNNEYLEKYLLLLTLNLSTEALENITQKHHAIPVVYYKQTSEIKSSTRSRHLYERLASNDPNNFLVNLKYSDHLLAHCYLALCAKPDWFKFANANMITVVSKYTNLDDFVKLESLEEFQKTYTLSCLLKQGKTLTEEHKAKIAAAHRRENISEEYRQKLSEAHRNRIWTSEAKNNLSKSLKSSEKFQNFIITRNKENPPARGLIWITNGEVKLRISQDKLSEYLAQGFWKGTTLTINIRKGYTEITINARDWPSYEAQGWKKGWKLSKSQHKEKN